MAAYILGLDLGPNSIGWAMLAADPEKLEPTGLYDTESAGHPPMGVRVFEAGLANFDTAKEMSLNQGRRTARSMRRNHARRNARRRQFRTLLTEHGLLPADEASLDVLFRTDPYELRARALTEDLELHDIGRALYHLCQRRGFRSNRKSGTAKEDQGILAEIGALDTAIRESGCNTLGEYLFSLVHGADPTRRTRLRNRHTRRDMYEREFEGIVARQRQRHANVLTDDVVSRLRHTLFFQHPFEVTEERRLKAHPRANMHRAPSVRPCPLEHEHLCCPRGMWEAQQFRIYKEVANLRVSEHRGKERKLTDEENQAILALLQSKDRVKFDDMRKALAKLGGDPEAMFNLERGARKALLGNSVEHKLAATVGRKGWAGVPEQTKQQLRRLLTEAEDPAELVDVLTDLGVDAEKAEKLASWTPADGYMGYSLEAILNLLPHLQAGKNEFEAIDAAYPNRPQSRSFDRLPHLSSNELPTEITNLTNPVVRRALVEVRKVVNAIIREHGKPARIVVEMAREMKEGSERRKETSKRNRDRQKRREDAAVEVARFGGNPNYREDIDRWLYWEEQDHQCLYTGRSIPAGELFSGGEWEVDHILPRWRSLDDSKMNKVLVHRSANLEKGNRTPAEWLGADSDAFDQMMRRAYGQLKKGNLPFPKFDRLRTRELSTDAFAQRQLNDTRYLTTVVVQFLALLYPAELRTGEKAIQSSRGGLTAELRRQWGLNNILPQLYDAKGNPLLTDRKDDEGNPLKSRDDHRHHAVDAVVVALSSRALLKRYQDYWQTRDNHAVETRPDFPSPWNEFRDDVRDMASRIIVSHRPLRKISGALHEETFYGPARTRDGEIKADRYVTRKPLDQLTGKMVVNIRDDVIRVLIEDRLRACGWDGKDNSLPKDWQKGPITTAEGTPVRKVRVEVAINNAHRLGNRYAILGNNHHLEFVASTEKDETGQPKEMLVATVSTMEAAERVRRRREPVVKRDHGEGYEFVMSLARKESVRINNPVTGEVVVGVVQTIAGASILSGQFDIRIRDCRDSRPATLGNSQPFIRLRSLRDWPSLRPTKMRVDPLGRLFGAGD